MFQIYERGKIFISDYTNTLFFLLEYFMIKEIQIYLVVVINEKFDVME